MPKEYYHICNKCRKPIKGKEVRRKIKFMEGGVLYVMPHYEWLHPSCAKRE